jgi:hypothetical protein
MAKYSAGVYGLSKYGERQVSYTYYESGIRSLSFAFGTVSLYWNSITADPNDPAPTHWRLIKSYSGTPDNPYDGQLLDGGVFTSFRNTYVDFSAGAINTQVNYSIWLFNGVQWVYSGDVNAIVVAETNTFDLVSKWIPRAWLNSASGLGETLGEYDSTDLTRTISAYTFEYDKFGAELDILQKSSYQTTVHNSLLLPQMDQLGFNYEPALGDTYHRALYKAGNVINGIKGTVKSVNAYVTGLTHLGNQVTTGHNHMLDYNDSSFEESTGRWSADSGTFTANAYVTSAADIGISLSAPVPPLYDHNYSFRAVGYGSWVIPTATTANLTLPGSGLSTSLYGIPVTQNVRYLFSGWVRTLAGSSTIKVQISWYDSNGVFISTNTQSTGQTITPSWAEFTSKSDFGRNGQLSPSGAVFASVNITASTSNSSTILFDLFQFAEASLSLEYEDARRVRVYLQGERQNLIPNPSFEEGSTGWIFSSNSSFAQDPTVYSTAIFAGSCLGELTINSSGTAWISSDWFPVNPGQNYTFSGYLASEYSNFGRAIPRIEFSNRESIDLQIRILSDTDGQYYDNTVYYTDGTPLILNPSATAYPITSASKNSNGTVITYISPGHNLSVGEAVTISGLSPNVYNLQGAFVDTIVDASTFTVTKIATPTTLATLFTGTPFTPITQDFVSATNGLATVVDQYLAGLPAQHVGYKQPFSVTAIAPQYTRDSGQPLAKVSIYYPDAWTNAGVNAQNFPPTVWHDGMQFLASSTPQSFFSGDGAPVPSDPVNNFFYSPNDTFWETKNIYNFISNPSFNTTTGWTATGGNLIVDTSTTNPSSSRQVVADNNYGLVTFTDTFGPRYGTSMGKVNYDPFNPTGATITTTVYLPAPAIGGEDVVVSAYIRGAEGVYTITTVSGGSTQSNILKVVQHDQYQWMRIHAIRQLLQGETSFTLSITLTPPAGFAYTLAPTSQFWIDGVQAEYGRIANKYLEPTASTTGTLPNPGNPAVNMYVAQLPSSNAGKSSYIFNYGVKMSRLKNSLPLVMPNGSSWAVKPGTPTLDYPDLANSLIPSASFEKDLGTWSPVNSNLQRVISGGTLSGDYVTHGAAYCLVTTAGSSGNKTFGITTAHIPVFGGNGYYNSVAIRPANKNSLGLYKVRIDYYSAGGATIPVYYGLVGANYVYSISTAVFTGAYSDVTNAYREQDVTITHADRWAFVNLVMPAYSTQGASYAILTVTYAPDTFSSTQAFHLDRVVFRQ